MGVRWARYLLPALVAAALIVAPQAHAGGSAGVVLPDTALSARPTAAPRAAARPYRIMVSVDDQQATVLTYDLNGQYTIPVCTFWCSTAKRGKITPLKTYALGSRYRWLSMVGNVYAQYAIRIDGPYMIHSVPYERRDPSTMIYSEYNKLGRPASSGCIRLQTADIRWIYENCAQGTLLVVTRQTIWPTLSCQTGLALLPDGLLGWDPSDPDAANVFPGGTTAAPAPAPGES